MRRFVRAFVLTGSVFALMDGAVQTVWAQDAAAPSASAEGDTLQEIIVTAERRSENLQKTAASVSVRNGDQMIEQGRTTLAEILQDIPGVSGVPTNTMYDPYAAISIRGVIPDNYSGPVIPSTAVYSDGVYQGLGGDYDLDHVEVLRGPQGTLYGRSATGGVIASYTRDPQLGVFGGDVIGSYSSFATRDGQAALNLPIGQNFAVRISGHVVDQTGYLDLPSEREAFRIKALYKPSDALSILIGAASQNDNIHQGGTNYELSTPNTTTASSTNPVTIAKDDQRQYWANVNYNFGPATVTYIPSLRFVSYAPNITYVGPTSGPIGVNPTVTPTDQTWSQELRLTSNDSKIKWIVGSFYYNNILSQDVYLDWLASGAEAFNNFDRRLTQDLGVFGETTIPVQDTLRLTLGLRYDYTAVDHTGTSINNLTQATTLTGCPTSPPGPANPCFGLVPNYSTITLDEHQGLSTFHNVTYKARLEKDLTASNMVYGSISSGFLPGDVQIGTLNQVLYKRQFNEETLTAVEIGSKNRFLDEKLQLNAAGFYYHYSGYQSDFEPTPTVPGSAHITITGPARMWGADLELDYRFTQYDTFNLTGGVLDAEFTGNPTFTFSGNTEYFLQGVGYRRFTNIAPGTITAALNHTLPLANGSSIAGRIDMQWSSAYNESTVNTYGIHGTTTLDDLERDSNVPAQTIGNISINWNSASGKYGFGGFIRNIANNVYKTGVNFNYTPSTSVSAAAVPSIGRVYGVTAHASF